jgi:periplasmic protein TonB
MKTKIESFDDIVFEHRNKEYGAYDLRRKYSKRGTIAFGISIFILFTAFGWPLIASIMEHNAYKKHLDKNTVVVMEDLKKKEAFVPPPPPPPPAPIKSIIFIAPVIVDSITKEEEMASMGEISEGVNSQPVDTNTVLVVNVVKDPEPVVDEIFEPFAIQEKPSFPDGDAGLLKYVREHTKYPVPALEQGIEGTVYVRFVVTKTGYVGEAKVMRAVDPMLEEEALRVVKSMPKWTPGKNNGNPVSVWFIMPVKFVLQ